MKRPTVETSKRPKRHMAGPLDGSHLTNGRGTVADPRTNVGAGGGPFGRWDVWTFGRFERALSTGEAPAIPADRAAALPRDLLRDDEVVILLLRPSVLFILLVPLNSLAVIVIFTLALALLAAKVNWIGWSEQQAYALGAFLVAMRLGWQGLEWLNRIYVLTDRRIVTRSGVLRVSIFETQLRSIQHTTVFMRLRERVCGLGTVGFATAGSDVLDTFWVMLRQPLVVHRTIVEAIQRYGNHK